MNTRCWLPRPQAPLQERKKKQGARGLMGRERISLFLYSNPTTPRAPHSTIPQLNGHRVQKGIDAWGRGRDGGMKQAYVFCELIRLDSGTVQSTDITAGTS